MTRALLTFRNHGWLVLGLAIFGFLSAFFHVSDVDVGYHMRTAEHILTYHAIPATNTFSYTVPDSPWLLQQWLGTLIFYAAYHGGGIVGLITFKATVVATLLLLVWAAGRRLTGENSPWSLWMATLAALLARIRFFERPDLLSALLFALVCLLDLRFDRRRGWQWLGLPLVAALWANVHSGVIYGLALLCARSAGEWVECLIIRKFRLSVPESNPLPARELWVRPIGILLAVGAACLAVQLINPNGCKVLSVPITQFASPFWQSVILEYQSPDWASYKLFFLSLAGLALLQLLTWRQLQWKLLVPTVGFGYLACSSQRSILFYAIVAMPHAAYMLHKLFSNPRARWSKALSGILPFAWAAIVVGVFLPNRTYVFGPGFYRPYYPLEIYEFIRHEVPAQHLFNDMRYGGSMEWFLYPDFKPFVDGRGDAYSEEFWKTEYLPVLALAQGWEDILRKYEVHGVLLPILEGQGIIPLARRLREHPQWALVAFNDATLLFLERVPMNQTVIARHEFRLLWPGDWSFAALNDPATRSIASGEAKRAIELSPDSLFARTAAARAAFVNEQFEQAALLLSRIVREEEVSETYYRDLGYAQFRCNRLDEADQTFALMLRRKILPGFAYYMRHHIALARGRVTEARQLLDQAIHAEPTNSDYLEARQRLDRPPTRP